MDNLHKISNKELLDELCFDIKISTDSEYKSYIKGIILERMDWKAHFLKEYNIFRIQNGIFCENECFEKFDKFINNVKIIKVSESTQDMVPSAEYIKNTIDYMHCIS